MWNLWPFVIFHDSLFGWGLSFRDLSFWGLSFRGLNFRDTPDDGVSFRLFRALYSHKARCLNQ